ncbi:MAG: cell division protein FtsQ/DivIB [Thermodesulfobacteriota bacterium]
MNSKRQPENRYSNTAVQTRPFSGEWPVTLLKGLSVAAAIAVMGLVFVSGYDWLTGCSYFRAESVDIKGAERLGQKQILEAAKISKGVNILSVNLNTARKRLLALPWVAEAEIRRDLPDAFAISVTEHRPVAVIELGSRFLVNSSGEIFKEAGSGESGELPLITGAKYRDWEEGGTVETRVADSVMSVLNRGRGSGSVLPAERVQRIEVDRELGLTVITEDFPAEKIYMGFGGYENKYRRLSKIFSYLERRGASSRFEEIDLRYPDRIVAKPAEAKKDLTKRQKEA